jgi:undecaprenyl diphosphate synthase
MTEKKLHLAIIPDGNRRWAKKKLLLPWKGHERAIENFRTLTEWCQNHPQVGVLTVWCFSTENWKRDEEEVRRLMEMLEGYLRDEAVTFMERGTRFVHSGRRDRIPQSLASLIVETEEKTKDCHQFTLHLAVDYGGKDEVVRALQRIPRTATITDDVIRAHCDHPELPDIDLILRSSGEQRTSNFFLWQSTYAEWIFSPKHFPEIGTDDLQSALEEFSKRQRRFGG